MRMCSLFSGVVVWLLLVASTIATQSTLEANLSSSDEEKCKFIRDSPPSAVPPQQDLCSLCQKITRARYEWDWQVRPFSRLCHNVPDDLQDWCKFFVCNLMNCPDFHAGSCDVAKGPGASDKGADNTVVITPCPSKYICYTCLHKYFSAQLAGCLDNLFTNI